MLKDKVFISFLSCIKKFFVGFTFGLPNVKTAYIEVPVIGGFIRLILPLEFLLCTGSSHEQHRKTFLLCTGSSYEQHIKTFPYVATREHQ